MFSTLRLLRWLGPWAAQDAAPRGVHRETIPIPTSTGDFEAWLYTPKGPAKGSWILAPGLHFLGPTDPRFDRFARVLASAGFWVFAPHIRDYMQLRVTPRALDDFAAAFDVLVGLPGRPTARPCVWSVSFGSAMAIDLVSNHRYAEQVGGLMTFGAFGDWIETSLYVLTGRVDGVVSTGRRDPLNRPAVFINVVDHMEGVPRDTNSLVSAWLQYCRTTWGNETHKRTSSRHRVAREIAEELDPEVRTLFLEGCGVGGKDSHRRAVDAITSHREAWSFLALEGRLDAVQCPVRIVHARDDDVIPLVQADVLEAYMPPQVDVRVYRTGLFGHSEPDASVLSPRRIRVVVREIATMIAMVHDMAAFAAQR